jgi:hypothetical protein
MVPESAFPVARSGGGTLPLVQQREGRQEMNTTEILAQWQSEHLKPPVLRFPKMVTARGERIGQTGSRFHFARVQLRFEPAETFIASTEGIPNDPDSLEFARGAMFGVLDVQF